MARRTQTYAIRLAVEGGGQVKAELISVGQSGEQSLKRIESAGERASGGLKGLGRQAELLRTGIRTLGGGMQNQSKPAFQLAAVAPAHRLDLLGEILPVHAAGVAVAQEPRLLLGPGEEIRLVVGTRRHLRSRLHPGHGSGPLYAKDIIIQRARARLGERAGS